MDRNVENTDGNTKEVNGETNEMAMDFTEAYPDTCSSVGMAARLGDIALLQELIWHGRPCDVKDNRGWTAVHEAAFHGHSGCLEFLLRREETDVCWKTFEDETPLLLAARGGHYESVRTLLENGAEPCSSTKEGYTPLWEAVEAGSLECVRYLLRRGADINHQVYTGYTPLHSTAEKGHGAILAYLIGHGARLDICADDDLTPIFLASQFGHKDCLRIMLKVAGDKGQLDLLNKTTSDNATPILIAAQEGHQDCIKLLLDYGADANIPVKEFNAVAAHFAIYKDRPRCLQLLLPVTRKELLYDNVHLTMHPLLLSLQLDNTTCLEILIAAGMNVKEKLQLNLDSIDSIIRDRDMFFNHLQYSTKTSVLCHIGYSWPLQGVEFLLRAGLTCDSQSQHELPPLLMAISRDAFGLCKLLLKHGANPNIYHERADGNLAALMAMRSDVRRTIVVTDHSTGKKVNIYAKYLCNILLAGGNTSSCFHDGAREEFIWRYDLPQVLEECSIVTNLYPIFTLLLCFSSKIRIHEKLRKLVFTNETEGFFQKLEDSTHTLSHCCRRTIVLDFVSEKLYKREFVSSLPVPKILQDFLMFMECGEGMSEIIMDSFHFNCR